MLIIVIELVTRLRLVTTTKEIIVTKISVIFLRDAAGK